MLAGNVFDNTNRGCSRAFRTGKAPILISTGLGSRGWDIMGVEHIINYDLPSTRFGGINEYIHRIGRTGRIGNKGLATSFYDEERDSDLAQDLVNCLVECDCQVPEFLSHLVPEEGKIRFDDDTDDEAEIGGDIKAEPGSGDGQDGSSPNEPETGFAADDGSSHW